MPERLCYVARMKTVRLILPASDIPSNAKVTKRTGSKQYLLLREIRVWPDGFGEKRLIQADEGTVLLLDPELGHVNALDERKMLVWCASVDDALRYLDPPDAR